MTLRYASVCSGIEAASVAWRPLGWEPVLLSEIERFPIRVLKRRHKAHDLRLVRPSMPHVPLWGDFTAIRPRFLRRLGIDPNSIDLLVGGTPCQAFSVAGKRRSLADERGNLSLQFIRFAHAIRSLRWLVWENVPGVLSTPDNAFGCFLGGLVGADDALHSPFGKRWPSVGMVAGPRARAAWRVFDAQHFGLAQRRERVFLVAGFGDGADPSAVLFERKGVQGDFTTGGNTGQTVAALTARGVGTCGADDNQGQAGHLIAQANVCSPPLTGNPYGDHASREGLLVAHTLRGEGFESEIFVADIAATLPAGGNSTGGNRQPGVSAETAATMLVAYRTSSNCGAWETGERVDALTTGTDPTSHVVAFALRGRDGGAQAELSGESISALRSASGGSTRDYIAFSSKDHGADAGSIAPTLRSGNHAESHANAGVPPAVASTSGVRRLTPRECERLMGFDDDYTRIPMRKLPPKAQAKARAAMAGGDDRIAEIDGDLWFMSPDGPRYKALGNSQAVPIMSWIGERIQAYEEGRL